MKILFLLSFLVFTASQSIAQTDPEKLLYLQKAEKFRKMKSTGRVLTVGGGILFVVGIATLANSSMSTTSSYGSTQTTSTGNPEAGILAYVVGSAGLGAGIPLWIIGKNNERKYNRKLEELSVGFKINPHQSGLTLSYRF